MHYASQLLKLSGTLLRIKDRQLFVQQLVDGINNIFPECEFTWSDTECMSKGLAIAWEECRLGYINCRLSEKLSETEWEDLTRWVENISIYLYQIDALTIASNTNNYFQNQTDAENFRIVTKAFELSPDSISLVSMVSWNFLYVNKQFLQATGYRREDVFGSSAIDLFTILNQSNLTTLLEGTDTDSTARNFETHFRMKSGERRIFSVYGEVIEVHNEPCVLFFSRDITDSKNVERVLTESENRYKIVTECSPVALFLHKNGLFTYLNKAALQMFKAKHQDELIGKPLSLVIHPDWMEKANERIDYLNDGHEIVELMDEQFVCLDGSVIDVQVQGVSVKIHGKNSILTYAQDITERKRFENALKLKEEELKRQNDSYLSLNEELAESNNRLANINVELTLAKDKAEESDRLKSSFLANISHEIRTPMNGIIGFSEMLKNAGLTETKRLYYVNIIIESGRRLMGIVNDVLDISKIESGQIDIRVDEVNVNETINELYALYKGRLNEKIALYPNKGLSDWDSVVLTDKMKLYQILNNLLSNAAKFTISGHIKFGYTVDDESICFFVEDTGIGIPKTMQSRVFERFWQVEQNPSKQRGGTGLGLAISHKLVEHLGGRIWVESDLSKGSTFYFTIPYKSIRRKVQESESSNYSKHTVLVAEDEDVNYLYLEEALSQLKISVIHARNGKEAVEMCRANTDICVVLMDIRMPQMNGDVAARQIKRFAPDIPIIAQTAYGLESEKNEYLKMGFDNYISKPIKTAMLIDMINEYLSECKRH